MTTKTKKKLATPRQMAAISQALANGDLDRDWAQTVIREVEGRRRRMSDDPNRMFWEERFPGKGDALMEVLRPFYGWEPDLKPAPADLEERAKRAIFWREIKGVWVYRVIETTNPGHPLGASFAAWLGTSHQPLLQESLWHSLRESFGVSLQPLLQESLWHSLFYPCWYILVDQPEQAAKFKPLHKEFWLAGIFPFGLDDEDILHAVSRDERVLVAD